MNEDNFDGGRRVICGACGGPAVRYETPDGSRVVFPIDDEKIYKYFKSRDDINDFIFDRLLRAEKIISKLRIELRELSSKLNGKG